MNAKERLILFSILLIAMLFLPLTLKATTEDEIVAAHLAKLEMKRPHRMVAPFFSFSYGSVKPASYHKFINMMNSFVIRPADPLSPDPLSKISEVTSFEGGCAVGVDRGLLTFGVSYWLTAGSANRGDYQYADMRTGLYDEVEDFTARSEFKVWGAFLDYQYFLFNPPQPFVRQSGISARAGAGLGYYTGSWYLWDGFGGYRTDTGEYYELEDCLRGSGMGFHLAAGIEYPFWNGFLFAVDAKYLWLEFDRMKKKLSPTYELFLLEEFGGDEPVRVDFTGPRVNLTIKHYFTL